MDCFFFPKQLKLLPEIAYTPRWILYGQDRVTPWADRVEHHHPGTYLC